MDTLLANPMAAEKHLRDPSERICYSRARPLLRMRRLAPLRSLLVLAFAAGARAAAPAAEHWALIYKQGALGIYQEVSQGQPTYKAEGIVAANLFDLLAVLSDIGRRPQWVENLKESRILEGNVDSKVVIYEEYHLPWPCQNRDSVVESVIHQNLAKLEVAVDYHEVTNPKAPPRAGVTRMPVLHGSMLFRYVDRTHSFARVIIGMKVGGDLPDWAVNHFARQAPLLPIEGLLRQVKRSRGQYDAFIRLHEAEARKVCEIPFEAGRP